MLISEKDLKKSIKDEINFFLLNEEDESAEATGEEKKEEDVEDSSDETNSVDESESSKVKGFLCQLEGIHIVLKELHWAADKHAEHVLLDEIDGGLLSLLDEVAEVAMGKLDMKFGLGDLKAWECDATDCKTVLARMEEVVIALKEKIGDDKKWAGLQSILDDFIGDIDKWNYLRTLS